MLRRSPLERDNRRICTEVLLSRKMRGINVALLLLLLLFLLNNHTILLVDGNECATVASDALCAHVSLQASLSLRSCYLFFGFSVR